MPTINVAVLLAAIVILRLRRRTEVQPAGRGLHGDQLFGTGRAHRLDSVGRVILGFGELASGITQSSR
ncbi:hypothetical protein OHU11_42025 (plasmid) [Streptomyces sp. NBC_00257]|uniref:hypothetical protein n=1 Tax=unclassified Streptomyces TaxID=2593676 RepID=UPI00224E9573|nr:MULTISPECIES: hypothetical protein [unclassified Streptomyces]MCX5434759.1 hypothetical protein [Streptomyces sp. NBC_00062]